MKKPKFEIGELVLYKSSPHKIGIRCIVENYGQTESVSLSFDESYYDLRLEEDNYKHIFKIVHRFWWTLTSIHPKSFIQDDGIVEEVNFVQNWLSANE